MWHLRNETYNKNEEKDDWKSSIYLSVNACLLLGRSPLAMRPLDWQLCWSRHFTRELTDISSQPHLINLSPLLTNCPLSLQPQCSQAVKIMKTPFMTLLSSGSGQMLAWPWYYWIMKTALRIRNSRCLSYPNKANHFIFSP